MSVHRLSSCRKSENDLWKIRISLVSSGGIRITEWRWRRVVDMRDVEVPRIVESSLRDNGLNASTIAPKVHFMLANTFDSWTSGNAYSRIWEYRESIPACPSCFVLSASERRS